MSVTAAEAPAQTVKSAVLTRLALVGGALEALAAKLKRFVAAKEQHLLVTAGTTAPKDAGETEGLAQEWQVTHSHRSLSCEAQKTSFAHHELYF